MRRSEDLALLAFISFTMKCSVMVDQLLSHADSDPFRSAGIDAVTAWKAQDSRLTEPPCYSTVLPEKLGSTAGEAPSRRPYR